MLKRIDTDLQLLNDFLGTKTPDSWIEYALTHIPLLLIDHAHCERKAAASAINFMSKYPQKAELIQIMSPLAREELLHFEKVLHLMHQRNIALIPLHPSNYASEMHQHVAKNVCEERLCDQLIIGAIIEARSCERFAVLAPFLADEDLKKFYTTLIKAEARHFQDYLKLAQLYGGALDARIKFFLEIENRYIESEDRVFRFHSGIFK